MECVIYPTQGTNLRVKKIGPINVSSSPGGAWGLNPDRQNNLIEA
jgi:hypothetical protein